MIYEMKNSVRKFRKYLKHKKKYYINVWYYYNDRWSKFFRDLFKTKKYKMAADSSESGRKIKVKYSSNRMVENILIYTKHSFSNPKIMLVIVFTLIIIIFLSAVINKDRISNLITGTNPEIFEPLRKK